MDGCEVDARAADLLRRRIPEEEFSFTFTRSSGPGGQNVNKVNTRVTLRFDLEACAALNDREKRRIRSRLASRVTRDGVLRIVAARRRSQLANRRAASDRFYELVADALRQQRTRKPTRVPGHVQRRRLEDKRRRSRIKAQRVGRRTDNSTD
ncbi:MAG: aminoacyl-tRNA hydrolase [Planctomycetes bacterium]|nr:aminoacyl-tRNA hydrolase [Planctomycetota bacterium]